MPPPTKLGSKIQQTASALRRAAASQDPEFAPFMGWYAVAASQNKLSPDPFHPLHYYDYFAAYKQGVRNPDKNGHWPSKFKTEGHPRMVLDGVNTKTGEKAVPRSKTKGFWQQIQSKMWEE